MNQLLLPVNLQLFSEGEEHETTTPPIETTGAEVQPKEQEVEPLNYEELLKTDKQLQTLIDRERTKAANVAKEKERIRQQQLATANLSRAEKEKIMKPEELAELYKREADELRTKIARSEEISELTKELSVVLEESKIPAELFNAGLDLYKTSADEARERALLFAKYEFFPKGTMAELVKEGIKNGIDTKLKQVPAESKQELEKDGTPLVLMESF
ncbi:MAG: hypothetical protein FWG63_03710 [Defluviitaleaceae bacterium]|nr:hypothetical protein [Defluviitaleaceae bacterium]